MTKTLLEHLKEPIDPLDKFIVGWNLKEIKETVQIFNKKGLSKNEIIIMKLMESKPKWAFNIRELVIETKISNIYYYLRSLTQRGIVLRFWQKTEYKYCLKEEWEKAKEVHNLNLKRTEK